jgi:Vps16, N-terminal region
VCQVPVSVSVSVCLCVAVSFRLSMGFYPQFLCGVVVLLPLLGEWFCVCVLDSLGSAFARLPLAMLPLAKHAHGRRLLSRPATFTRVDDQLTSGSHRCIRLFSSSGRPLSSFVVSKSKRIVGMGWSAREELVVVMDEGTVMLFGIHTRSLKEVCVCSCRCMALCLVLLWFVQR